MKETKELQKQVESMPTAEIGKWISENFMEKQPESVKDKIIGKLEEIIIHLKAYDSLWEIREYKEWRDKKHKLESELAELKKESEEKPPSDYNCVRFGE